MVLLAGYQTLTPLSDQGGFLARAMGISIPLFFFPVKPRLGGDSSMTRAHIIMTVTSEFSSTFRF